MASTSARTSFAGINLRCNPFGERSRYNRALCAVTTIDQYHPTLCHAGNALQFCGDHGRGKSTHLISLHHTYFSDAPYTQLHPGDPLPEKSSSTNQHQVHFIDSIENLSKRHRRQLYRFCPSLACTTHTDLSKEFKKAGYAVTTVHIGNTSPSVVLEIVRTRIEHARLNEGPVPEVATERLNELLKKHGDDIRSIEFDLYKDFQRLKERHG